MNRKKYFILSFILLSGIIFSQTNVTIETAVKAYKHVILINGVAHIGNGKIIESSYIAFSNGKLEMVVESKGIKLNPAS